MAGLLRSRSRKSYQISQLRWGGTLVSNPFRCARSPAPKAAEDADPRRRHRALSPDELSCLIAVAREAPRQPALRRRVEEAGVRSRAPQCLTGRERAILYTILAGTGLRVGEV